MKIKVWDIPTRVFHWTLVLSFASVFLTSEDESVLEYHVIAGYVILALAVFRFFWGFAGGRFSRFSDFLGGPGEVAAFMRKALKLTPPRHLGHNPAVGWVVVLMLLCSAVIPVAGIIVYAGEENMGVFAGVFTFEAAVWARAVHTFLAYAMVVVIAVHILAALFHDFVLRENIILSMVTGTKEDDGTWGERVGKLGPHEGRSALRLSIWIALTVFGALGIVFLPPEGRSDFTKLKEPKVVDERGFAQEIAPATPWVSECATSCHAAFHPTLLPERSWRAIMGSLNDHFGEDATLDKKTAIEITDYLVASSAERSTTEASRKILYSLRRGETPLRVTDTPYWKDKHSEIDEAVFNRKSVTSRSNCKACHPGAEKGSFEDRDIGIPD